MRRIGPDQLRTHGNNFNAIRLVLASCVIWSHSYGLINGLNNQDNLNFLIGRPISWLAVNGFFFVSGFLVCQSMLRQPDMSRFALSANRPHLAWADDQPVRHRDRLCLS